MADWPIFDEEIAAVFQQAQVDGTWGKYHGPHTQRLQAALTEYLGTTHVHLCCSGTSAVELALRAAGVAGGDEVVLCAYDFKANFVNVLLLDGVPVLVDTEPDRPVPAVQAIEAAMTEKTRAVLVGHLHGCLADVSAIRKLCDDRGVTLIEDACQVPGARIDVGDCARHAGTIGHLGVLSFGGSKLLTSGRGGAVVTDDGVLAQRIRLFTQRGNDAYPLSELQAALLLPQLRQLDQRNLARWERALHLLLRLESHGVRSPLDVRAGNPPALYKLPLLLPSEVVDRVDGIAAEAERAGVPLHRGFELLHQIHSRRRFRVAGTLSNSESLVQRMLLVHHPVLLDDVRAVDEVADWLLTRLNAS